jgi:hypothetical protein
MNASGLSVLNPIDDAKVIVARGAAVMLGLLFLVAGGAILVKELLGAEQAQSLLNGAGPIGTGARRLTAAAPIAALAA